MHQARLTTKTGDPISSIDRRLFGSFVEHLGRAVYDGIYDPAHSSADDRGFRADVMEMVRELGVTTIRYPGGNFVSGYRWEDGVGPVAERPARLDLAWHSTEVNRIGLDEFAQWCAEVGSELMLAVNLGTRGIEEAVDLLEYTNVKSGTHLSDARVANGTKEPHGVRVWCLGNEMDGPWQLGHMSAEDYGKLAARTARAMRMVDKDLQLVACGSSSRVMPTFGTWERQVLEQCYDEVDYISCHAYYCEKDDLQSFLASPADMDRFIESVVATADHVKAVKSHDKEMYISFDEWNVWDIDRYHGEDAVTDAQEWPVAPRLLEDSYTVADAVVVGGLMISLLRHADRVKAASLAQLVNVIAPIMTEPGGPAWRQTTFFPFAATARLAHGDVRGVDIEAPMVTTTHGEVSLVDAIATSDGDASAVFLVNRSLDQPLAVTIDVAALGARSIVDTTSVWDEDVHARNVLDDPERVLPRTNDTAAIVDGTLTITLPPVSWSAVELSSNP